MLRRAIPVVALLVGAVPAPAEPAERPRVRVLLTFDDGPDAPDTGRPGYTLQIADVLRRKALNGVADDIKAAFFVQTGVSYRGGSRLGLETMRALAARGHVLGVHTGTVGGEEADHLDHVALQQQGVLGADLERARERLREIGVEAKYVRPTYGRFDTEVLRTYDAHRLKVVLWDADSRDATDIEDPVSGRSRPPTATEVIGALRDGEDSVAQAIAHGARDVVVLFHDICPTTAAHLGEYTRAVYQTASVVQGRQYRVECVTRTQDVEEILAGRQDASAAEDADPGAPTAAPDLVADRPADRSAPWGWGVAAAVGAIAGMVAALALRRRATGPAVVALPLPALATLARQPELTGPQAACVADALQRVRPEDLRRMELAAYLSRLEAGSAPSTSDTTAVTDQAAQEGLIRSDDGQWRLTDRGAEWLAEFRATDAEGDWAQFVLDHLHQPLEVTCPTCGGTQVGHWLRPTLSCLRCHRRFDLSASPLVRPGAARPDPVGTPSAARGPRAPVRPSARRARRVAVGLVAAGLVALGAVVWLRHAPVPPVGVVHQIVTDQFGYRPGAEKWVVFCWPQQGQFSDLPPFDPGAEFRVLRAEDDTVAFVGPVRVWNEGRTDPLSGDRAWHGDFSAVTAPGRYYVSVPGGTNPGARSHEFLIRDDVYAPVLRAAGRAFYYQRCGTDQLPTHGGRWYHAACHCNKGQDRSAWLWDGNAGRPAGRPRDVHGGWHDAGDYSKYVEYTFAALWDLLHAAEWYPGAFSDATEIPESGNGVPDILDEVKYELDWLLRMQLADGSVSAKVGVTDYEHDNASPPELAREPRYYTAPSTGATATVAAAAALGARLFRQYEGPYPGYADRLRAAAERAWGYLDAHPEQVVSPDGGMGSPILGPNGAVLLEGEGSSNSNVTAAQDRQLRVAVAAELFALTGKAVYRNYVDAHHASAESAEDGHQPIRSRAFSVGSSGWLQRGLVSYALAPGATPAVVAAVKSALERGVEQHLMARADADPYRAPIPRDLYNWGSNQRKAGAAQLALWAVRLDVAPARRSAYRVAAVEYLHYFHGRNPLGIVYLTNMGPKGADAGAKVSIMRPYHSWFRERDPLYDGPGSKYGPAPGLVTGGPNAFYKGTRLPPKGEPPMKAFFDWNSRTAGQNAWEVNEPQIATQAAYTFLIAAACTDGPPGR